MPYNGSGGFTIINTFVPGTTILSSAVNQNYSDIATSGLSNCLTKDGQQTWGANQKAGGFLINNLGAGVANTDAVNLGQVPGLALPVGTVVDFAGTSAPSLWYFCYGQSFSTTTFASLFNAIGYTYGGAGGSFNLPDYRGRVGAGKDNMGGTPAGIITTLVTDSGTIVGTTLGSLGGSQQHVQASGELAAHIHSATSIVTDPQHHHGPNVGSNYIMDGGSGAQVGGSGLQATSQTANASTGITVATTIGNAGSSSGMAWLQPTIITNKIIFANA